MQAHRGQILMKIIFMALLTFLTVEEADLILGENLPWFESTEEKKQDALEMARIYTQNNYSIRFNVEEEAPEQVKIGNSLIANENLISDIFSRQNGLGALEETTVKASSVTTTKKYKNQIVRTWRDPFTKATAIMNPFCILKSRGGVKVQQLVRG